VIHRSLLVFASLFALAAPAFADGFIIVEEPVEIERRSRPIMPRPVPIQRHFPLAVENHTVTVQIDGQVATTSVDQTFRNPINRRLEGTYMFPLPEDAAVTDFSLWIDGKETPGEVLDRKKALDIYEGIVRRMQDPALLEYAGRGMFKVRIFPIEPMSTRRIKLTYRQVLPADHGRVRYQYPLNTEKFSSQPLKQASVLVEIKGDTPIKGIYSPWHDVDVRRDGETGAKASWEATNVTPNRDFVLDYDLAPGDVAMSLRTHAIPAEDGTFLLMISPKVEVPRDQLVAKDVVFVVDTSGTMATDDKMEQARGALAYCIARLEAQDRFAVVSFATDARTYRDELVTASDEQKAGAQHFVKQLKARGGTAIDDALARALAYRSESQAGRPFTIVFLTDGQPTIGETDIEQILKNAKTRAAAEGAREARLFVWGVGHDLNTHLLDRLALEHRGDRNYVLPGEDIEVAMSSFYDKIASPVLTDLNLEFTNVRTHDVYPKRLPDLFHGTQLVVVGRFTGEGHGAIKLTGKVGGETREFVWEGDFERSTDANPHVPRLWARRKIGYLLDQIRLNGIQAELKDEVVRLARRHGLPTPFTSYLVLEEQELRRQGRPNAGAVPEPMAPGDSAAEDAFGAIEKRMRESEGAGGRGFSRAPAAEADGADAVEESRQAARLRRADRAELDDEAAGPAQQALREAIRTVGDRTFYKHGEGWVQSTVGTKADATEWVTITYMSDEYFAFVREHPELGECLALGKVTFKVNGTVYEVKS
jgi:Ca-activated chloride channel family protein